MVPYYTNRFFFISQQNGHILYYFTNIKFIKGMQEIYFHKKVKSSSTEVLIPARSTVRITWSQTFLPYFFNVDIIGELAKFW